MSNLVEKLWMYGKYSGSRVTVVSILEILLSCYKERDPNKRFQRLEKYHKNYRGGVPQ